MAKKTLSGYPKEFADIWALALAGTLVLEFPMRGTAINLRSRLYAYRKRMDEEAPMMAAPYKSVDLVISDKRNAAEQFELRGAILAWKAQTRALAAQLAAVKGLPSTSTTQLAVVEGQSQQVLIPQFPAIPAVSGELGTPQAAEGVGKEQDAMDDTLKHLGFGTGHE